MNNIDILELCNKLKSYDINLNINIKSQDIFYDYERKNKKVEKMEEKWRKNH